VGSALTRGTNPPLSREKPTRCRWSERSDAEGRHPCRRSTCTVQIAGEDRWTHPRPIGLSTARAPLALCASTGRFCTTARATVPLAAFLRASVAVLPSGRAWPLGWRASAIKESHDMSLWLGREGPISGTPPQEIPTNTLIRWALPTKASSLGTPTDKVHSDFHACPNCDGRGTVQSRLPFRTKPSDQCRGRGVMTPLRRQQLLAKLKAKTRERVKSSQARSEFAKKQSAGRRRAYARRGQ
jgi:hypothetical protein